MVASGVKLIISGVWNTENLKSQTGHLETELVTALCFSEEKGAVSEACSITCTAWNSMENNTANMRKKLICTLTAFMPGKSMKNNKQWKGF